MSLRENLLGKAVTALRMLEPIVLDADACVGDAVRLMQEHHVGCVFVVERGRPIGVFTERDVLKRVIASRLSSDTPLTDAMTRNPRAIGQDWSVANVIHAMHEGGFRHMPLVDEAGCLTGVVSVKRVVEFLVDHFPSAVFNLPPTPDQSLATREGA